MFAQIFKHAQQRPQAIALQGASSQLTYADLQREVLQLADWLSADAPGGGIGLAMDNSPAWIVADLAALYGQRPTIPLPAFFSEAQKQHALVDAGVHLLLTDHPEYWLQLCPQAALLTVKLVAGLSVSVLRFPAMPRQQSAAKITYTSGTTGQPKGVCLSADAMWQVAQTVCQATQQSAADRHLCVLPLATLLENVAGVYASLLAGATVVVPGCAQVGFSGSQFRIDALYAALQSQQATTAILIPELFQALLQYVAAGHAAPAALRFVAVGGARVEAALLQQARQLQLPVYEGYGLSECASVVTLNLPDANKPGSIGRALPHVQLRVDAQGELWVKGPHYLGYAQKEGGYVAAMQDADGFIATGDLGYQDSEGYWFVNGRKKHVFITSFGRNVSPEWVESALQAAGLAQVCLFGEARPFNVAVVVLRAGQREEAAAAHIAQVNHGLPDYARVGRWVIAQSPFTPQNMQLTANGRLRRDQIWQDYQSQIASLYTIETI
ncbi:MAG TPA: AMP-binding protein [Methylophilus sp.]